MGIKRVLIVEPAGNLWGSERVLLDMLSAEGHREGSPDGWPDKLCFAVCCPPRSAIVEKLRKIRIRVFPTFVSGLHEKTRIARFIALIGLLWSCAVYRPNLLYLNQAGCYRIASIAARIFGIAIVSHIRIFEDAAYLARQEPSPYRLKRIIAISGAVRDEIQTSPGLRDIPVSVIYDGYSPSVNGSDTVVGRDAKENILACVGRIVPIKGQDILVDSLAVLKGKHIPIRCLMIGTGGEFWQQLRDAAAAAGLSDFIEWLGFQENPIALLRQVKVLVVPSHQEPLGRVIFEAWNAGCIPIAFGGSGGAAEVLAASGGGILYDEQTPNCLAEAIGKALLTDDTERAEMVARGREWMAENCSLSRYADSMKEIFIQAASGRN